MSLADLFPKYVPLTGLTEAQAIHRLEKRAWWIVRHARWTNLGRAKVNELRQPLLEIYLARRANRGRLTTSRPVAPHQQEK